MTFDELMKQGWQDLQCVKSIEDNLRERLLLAENRIVSLEQQVRKLRSDADKKTTQVASPKKSIERVPRDKQYRQWRAVLFDMHAGRCFYCDEEVSYNEATIDHQVPIIKEGSGDLDNLVMACYPCNSSKGGRMPTADELERAKFIRDRYNGPRNYPLNIIPLKYPMANPIREIEREIEAKILSERGL